MNDLKPAPDDIDIVHFSKTSQNRRYRPICTDKWTSIYFENSVGQTVMVKRVTVPHGVTCPRCLKILIEKYENALTIMKAILNQSPAEKPVEYIGDDYGIGE